jgi:hypothetical protein
MTNLYVSISPTEVAKLINKTIVNNSITGELIDEYVTDTSNGTMIIVQVYEKHYYRAGNRLTLTIVIDDVSGKTHIHAIGGGGGQGIFRFDGGASGSFEDSIYDAIYQYIIK